MTTEQIRAFQERVLPYLERTRDKEELIRVCELAMRTSQEENAEK